MAWHSLITAFFLIFDMMVNNHDINTLHRMTGNTWQLISEWVIFQHRTTPDILNTILEVLPNCAYIYPPFDTSLTNSVPYWTQPKWNTTGSIGPVAVLWFHSWINYKELASCSPESINEFPYCFINSVLLFSALVCKKVSAFLGTFPNRLLTSRSSKSWT